MNGASFIMYLPAALGYSTICVLIGFAVLSLGKWKVESLFFKTFLALLTGQVVTIVFYALLITNGKSVFLGTFLLACFLFWYFLPRHKADWRISKDSIKQLVPVVVWLLAYHVVHFLILACRYYFPAEDLFFITNSDISLYAEFGDFIHLSGQENRSGGSNLISTGFHGTAPYHYYDIYLGKIQALLFGLKSLYAYAISGTISAGFIVATGYVALFRHFLHRRRNIHYLIAVLFLLPVGFVLPIYYKDELLRNLLVGSFDHPILSVFNFLRSGVIQQFLLLSILCWVKGHKQFAIASLLILPFTNIVMGFSVLPAVGLYALINFLRDRQKSNLFLIGISVFTGLFIITFYLATGADMVRHKSFIMKYDSIKDVFHVALYAIKYVLRTIVIYAPIIALIIWLGIKNHWFKKPHIPGLIQVGLMTLLFGLLAGALLNQNFDGIQLYTNITRELMLIGALVLFIFILKNVSGKRFYRVGMVSFGLLLFTGLLSQTLYTVSKKYDRTSHDVPYSQLFIERVNDIVGDTGNSELQAVSLRTKYSRYPYNISLLYNCVNNASIHNIDYGEFLKENISTDKINVEEVMMNTSFMHFVETTGIEDYETAKVEFIKQNNIQLALKERAYVLSPALDELVEYRFSDTKYPIDILVFKQAQ